VLEMSLSLVAHSTKWELRPPQALARWLWVY